MSQFLNSHVLILLLLVSLSSIPDSNALEVPGLHLHFPMFNNGPTTSELREPSHSPAAKPVGDTSERQTAGLTRNQGRAGTSRNMLAYATAERSFNSPDNFSKNKGALGMRNMTAPNAPSRH